MIRLIWDSIKTYLLEYISLDILATFITFLVWFFFRHNMNIFVVLIFLYVFIDVWVGYRSGKENDIYAVVSQFLILVIYQFLIYFLLRWLYPEFSNIRLLFSWYSMLRGGFFVYAIAAFWGWKTY